MRNLFLIALSALVIFSSCREIFAKRIRGNGNIVSQEREVGDFNSVRVSGSIDIYASQDSSSSVKIETDENLQQYYEVMNDGGELRIHSKSGYNPRPSKAVKGYVSAAQFKSFEASGSCDIFSQNQISSTDALDLHASGSCKITMDLNAPKIKAHVSGSCDINLKGQTTDLTIGGSGRTDIRCFELKADNVDLNLSGASDVELYAEKTLTGSGSGSTDIKYKGNAFSTVKNSGASQIKRVN